MATTGTAATGARTLIPVLTVTTVTVTLAVLAGCAALTAALCAWHAAAERSVAFAAAVVPLAGFAAFLAVAALKVSGW